MGNDLKLQCGRALALLLGVAIVAGCHRTPTLEHDGGVRLVYQVDAERMAEFGDEWEPHPDDLSNLAQAIAARLDEFPGTTIEPQGDDSLEIIIPGAVEDDGEYIHELITRWGMLEFNIVANQRDHAEIIEQAWSDPQAENVVVDGIKVARWVHVGVEDENPHGKPEYHGVMIGDVLRARRKNESEHVPIEIPEEASRKVAREAATLHETLMGLGYRDLQVLVVLEPPGLNISGRHLQSVFKTYDFSSLPAVGFRMTDDGAKLMERLSGDNLPNTSEGFHRRMGILFDRELIAAPRLLSTIGRDGQITGNFTEKEVDFLVRLLRCGRLPVLPKSEPTSEEWQSAKD